MKRFLALAMALLVMGCARGATPVSSQISDQVLVVDRAYGDFRLLRVDVETGTSESIVTLDCNGCAPPVPGPDGRSLYMLYPKPAGIRIVSGYVGPTYETRLLTIDSDTGQVKQGPVIAAGVLAWGWSVLGVSPDERFLYVNIPNNPNNNEHPLYQFGGVARYDLKAERLEEKPLTRRPAQMVIPSADGQSLSLCCWVQGHSHPVPGLYMVDAESGADRGRVWIEASAQQVHPTRIAPAGDGSRFYALRAGTDEWWVLREAGVERSGHIKLSWREQAAAALFPVAHAKGPYELAVGAMVADRSGQRLYSSLYLAEADSSRPVPQKHLEGGGILVLDTADFSKQAHLDPDRTYEHLALGQGGTLLYALDTEGEELVTYDIRTLKVASRVRIKGRPSHLISLRR